MPKSEIPVDVLRDILDYVDKGDLPNICRVNKICCYCSQDVLYRDIYVENRRISSVQQILAQSTHLARKVRSFDTLFDTDHLATALRNMTSLRKLRLPFRIYMDILDGCTFRLDSLGCYGVRNRNGSFQKFLSSQPSLEYVTFTMSFDPTLSLEATCLPNLTRIYATFPWLPYLIPGRPVNEVITGQCTENNHSTDLSFFALSTTPIRKLKIDYSYLYLTPGHLLASFLPSLAHFTLTVFNCFSVFTDEGLGSDVDDWIENMLVAFVSLREFTLDLLSEYRHSENHLQYITKVSHQAPHLELFTIQYDEDYAFRCKRVNANWIVCDEDE